MDKLTIGDTRKGFWEDLSLETKSYSTIRSINALNKIIFNRRILPALEKDNLIPLEILGSRRSQSIIYIALNKKLIADIANQVKSPLIVISVDATNYYDRVAHPFASLTIQYFGV